MNALTALLLTTPIYGFSLTPPAMPQSLFASPLLLPEVEDAPVDQGDDAAGAEDAGPSEVETPGRPDAAAPPEASAPEGAGATASAARERGGERSFAEVAAEGERQRRLRNIHRAFGITTWALMTATITLGAIQFADIYGAGDIADTRCAQGDPLLGSTACDVPWPHIIAVSLTTASYFTTFGLSFALRSSVGPNDTGGRALRVRMHRALRWVHFAGMAAQIVGGVIFANLDSLGVSRDENYDTLRGLNIYHLAVGGLTWVALTWAGALLVGG